MLVVMTKSTRGLALIIALGVVLMVVAGCRPSPTEPPPPTSTLMPVPTATSTEPPTAAPQTATLPPPPTSTPPESPTVTQPPAPSDTPPPPATSTPAQPPTDTPQPPAAADARIGAVFFSGDVNDPNIPCAELQALGVGSTFVGARWGEIEIQPGVYGWGSVDPVVDAALACGLEPVLKVSTSAGRGRDGEPTEDIDAYARFAAALAQHMKGRVRAYAIENEVDKVRLAWTADNYGPLRAAAYQAIKQADPGAYVLDSGMTMQAYLLARADELVRAGKADEAVAELAEFSRHIRRKDTSLPTNRAQLDRWLNRPQSARIIELARELYQNQDTFDAVQLHFLQDAWEMMPEYTGWVRSWTDKPYEFWEIGYGWDGPQFTEEDHANGVVKTLVMALGEGAGRVIYEPYSEGGNNVGRGLVPPGGPRLAATAYQTLTSQLDGYASVDRLELGPDVWAYRFSKPGADTYVLWATGSTVVSLPVSVAEARVTDIFGDSTIANPTALSAGPGPLFVTIP